MKIINKEIIALIDAGVIELESINLAQEAINKRIDTLGKQNQLFVDAMNEEYGWGNWNNVNAKTYEFTPREEFEKAYYIIQNPAIKDQVKTGDIDLKESGIVNQEVSLEKFKELYPNHEAFKHED